MSVSERIPSESVPQMIAMKTLVLAIGLTAMVMAIAFQTAEATQVKPCTDDLKAVNKEGPIPDDTVTIPGCTKPPCRFRRKSTIPTEFKLKPTRDIKTLKNEVYGLILGVPFPFFGVDGTNACEGVYLADGKTKAGCPLKAGTDYVVKNDIKILEIYPKIKVLAHWALVAEDGSKPLCFNAQVRITS